MKKVISLFFFLLIAGGFVFTADKVGGIQDDPLIVLIDNTDVITDFQVLNVNC